MIPQLLSSPITFLYWFLAFGISLSVHEAAHAWMADRLGDPTAKLSGRLTLNPFAHIDPLGTLMLLIFRFGWGKPVPFDPYNLRNPRRDAGLISLSGPSANLILSTLCSLLFRLTSQLSPITYLLIPIITLNVYWAIFNLLPFHPLDGGKVLVGFLPQDLAYKVEQILEQFSLIFILFLFFPIFGVSLISAIIEPVANFILGFLLPGASFI